MSETARIARFLEQTFEGPAYYGPSVLGALAGVDAATAARKPPSGGRTHLKTETRSMRCRACSTSRSPS